MSILYAKGNILESQATVLVNPVNTQGVMGAGLAQQFAQRHPDMLNDYRHLCWEKKIGIGKPWWWVAQVDNDGQPEQYILLFPTKDNWRRPSRLTYIEYGLKQFVEDLNYYSVKSVAWPMLGCGLGGLLWSDVEPLMAKYLADTYVVNILYVEE